jgi:hypothetical protein
MVIFCGPFFYLKKSRNCQINDNVENLKLLRNFFLFISPSDIFKLILENYKTRGRPLVTPKKHFFNSQGVKKTITAIAVTTTFRVLY